MATQEGSNVKVYSVVGNFDDAQNGVKKIFGDPEINAALDRKGEFLSSANSINWGRLVPQVVYYISAYCDLVKAGDIKCGDGINVCVPTGNFGNILAAYIAKNMGLPIAKFVCASNCNNVLTDFFTTGTYDRNRVFHTTTSPSMDILISSNLERLLYLAAGSEKTAEYMKELASAGRYTVSDDVKEKLSACFSAGYCDEEQTAKEIKKIWDREHYLADTHTAVGLYCAEKYIESTGDNRIMLSVSTASPYKFAPSVLRDLTGAVPENELDALDELERVTSVPIPAPLAGIGTRRIRFDPENAIEPAMMPEVILKD